MNSLRPVVVNARDQLIARQQQQKKIYDRSAKALPPLQEGKVVRLHHNGESQRAIVRERANPTRYYLVDTEDGSTLRRNRRHLRQTAEDQPIIAPHLIDECDPSPSAQPARRQSSTLSTGQPPPTSIIRRSARTTKLPVRFNDYVMTVTY